MNKYYISIIALLLCLTSCSESFLDTSSKTESNSATFYTTENDAYRALIGAYAAWRETNSRTTDAFAVISEVLADECFGGTGFSDGWAYQAMDRFDISVSSGDLNIHKDAWTYYYAAIYRCNELINNEEKIQWDATSGKKELYMGQAKAIRAFLYFDLVRLFEKVPLLTQATSEVVPQSEPSAVYDLIVSDLKYAIANIPANAFPKANAATNDGQITKYACEAMAARVFLFYNGYYGANPGSLTKEEALAYCEDVIASGEYGLIDDFKNLWPAASKVSTEAGSWNAELSTYAGNGNKETILTMKFNYTQDYNGNNDGNRWLVMVGVRNYSVSPYGQGWGACTVNPEFVKSFSTGDTRLAASVIDLKGEGIAGTDDFKNANCVSDQREYTGYYIKKYTPMSYFGNASDVVTDGAVDFQIGQKQDWVIMRYADVLLMAAELGSPNAQSYYDQVRKRAYKESYTAKEATKSNILEERKFEFAFEGIRYWDLLRQGLDVAASEIAINNYPVLSGGQDATVTIDASRILTTRGFCQIPYDEITLSDNVLIQNPGW